MPTSDESRAGACHNQIRCEAPSESEAPISICEGCSKFSTTSVSAREIRATHSQAPLHRPRLHEIGAFLAKTQGLEILCKLIPPLLIFPTAGHKGWTNEAEIFEETQTPPPGSLRPVHSPFWHRELWEGSRSAGGR